MVVVLLLFNLPAPPKFPQSGNDPVTLAGAVTVPDCLLKLCVIGVQIA